MNILTDSSKMSIYSTQALQTVYNQTLGRFVTNDMKQKYITPYYYMCMNYIAGNDQIRFDGEVIRCAGFESESIKYQLSAEEKALLDFLDELEEDDIFFDIGAHIGIYSIIASKKSKEIHSFEPHGGNYVRLNQNIQKNSIDTIFTHNVALGNEAKCARGMKGGAVFKIANTTDTTDAGVRIENGDEYRERMDISVPSVIKIDVEGFEHNVIRGLRDTLQNSRCRALFIEVHREVNNRERVSEQNIELMYESLNSFGYTIKKIQNKDGQQIIKAIK